MRQEYVFPYKPLLFRVVVLYAVVIIVNLIAADICGSSNGRTSLAPANNFCFKMIYRYFYHYPFLILLLCPFGFRRSLSPSESARSRPQGGIPPPSPRTVVSKCALTGKSSGTLGCPNVPLLKVAPQFCINNTPIRQAP